MEQVADVDGVGERFVRECVAALARLLPPGETPWVLGLDACSMKRGERYETVCCALEAPWVLEGLEGRDGASVQPYLEGVREPDRVGGTVLDRSEG